MALKEVCIKTRNTGGKAVEGDVIVIRNPLGVVGTKEMADFVWLLIDDSELPAGRLSGKNEQGEYSYRLPLETLQEILPSFDLVRARDRAQNYQPFLNINTTTGRYTRQDRTQLGGRQVETRP